MDPFLALEWIDYEGGDLEIPWGGVHLWLIEPASELVRYLSPTELLRYKRIVNEEVRVSYGAAQGGLRRIVGVYMRRPAAEALAMRRAARGSLMSSVLRSSTFLIRRKDDRGLFARPVGIDVEAAGRRCRRRSWRGSSFSRRKGKIMLCERAERDLTFLRYWVCKEAMVKLSGDGIYHGLRHARVDLSPDGRSQGGYQGRAVALREFRPAPDLLAALASWEPVEAKGFFRI